MSDTTIQVTQDLAVVEVLADIVTDVEVFMEVSVSTVQADIVEVLVEGGQGLPGKSAYESAVEFGFNGTEAMWAAQMSGYPAKTLVRQAGLLTAVQLYADAGKTQLALTVKLVRSNGVLSSVEYRKPDNSLWKRKLLQRDAQGQLVGVGYADS